MPRKPRIHYDGALYHVICRGNNREWIFKSEKEKSRYLETVEAYRWKHGCRIYAFVIMSNHAHLLIKVGKTPLSKIMQCIQQSYTKWYNRERRGSGHVFEQRYKSFLCNEDAYLLALIRYIHQNPVRAKLPEGLEYVWSSHSSYTGKHPRKWLDVRYPLSLLGPANRVERYLDFVNSEDDVMSTLSPALLEEGTWDDERYEVDGVGDAHSNIALGVVVDSICRHYGISRTELKGCS